MVKLHYTLYKEGFKLGFVQNGQETICEINLKGLNFDDKEELKKYIKNKVVEITGLQPDEILNLDKDILNISNNFEELVFNDIVEFCDNCNKEVVIPKNGGKCPYCGKWLYPCSLCDMDKVDCNNCKYKNKTEIYKKHLEKNKEHLMDRLFNILNGTGFEKFTAKNIQEIADDLKEIEILQEFLKSDDFEIIEK